MPARVSLMISPALHAYVCHSSSPSHAYTQVREFVKKVATRQPEDAGSPAGGVVSTTFNNFSNGLIGSNKLGKVRFGGTLAGRQSSRKTSATPDDDKLSGPQATIANLMRESTNASGEMAEKSLAGEKSLKPMREVTRSRKDSRSRRKHSLSRTPAAAAVAV